MSGECSFMDDTSLCLQIKTLFIKKSAPHSPYDNYYLVLSPWLQAVALIADVTMPNKSILAFSSSNDLNDT